MIQKNASQRAQHVDILFVLMLFGIMAISLLTVIMLGANVYSRTAELMQHNYEARTTIGYVSGKVRQNDSKGGLEIADIDGISVLKLNEDINKNTYVTYIYYYDGSLCEFFADGSLPFAPENGQKIVAIKSFTATRTEKDLIHLEVTDTAGDSADAFISVRCA